MLGTRFARMMRCFDNMEMELKCIKQGVPGIYIITVTISSSSLIPFAILLQLKESSSDKDFEHPRSDHTEEQAAADESGPPKRAAESHYRGNNAEHRYKPDTKQSGTLCSHKLGFARVEASP